MKKAIITLLTIIVFITAMSGCTQVGAGEKKTLEIISRQYEAYDGNISIYYDVKTGVEYIKFEDCAPVVRINADGTPVVYKGE